MASRGCRRAGGPVRGMAHGAAPAGASQPTPTSAARARSLLTGPCALCHTIRGTDRQRPVAPDLTHLASRFTHRRRHAAQHARQPGRLDRRSAARQAGQSHAGHESLSRRTCNALLAYLGESASERPTRRVEPGPQLDERSCDAALERAWADRPGFFGWFDDVDHKPIGTRYHRHGVHLLRAWRRAGAADAAATRSPENTSRRPRPLQSDLHRARHAR